MRCDRGFVEADYEDEVDSEATRVIADTECDIEQPTHRGAMFVACALGVFMVSVDSTIVATALGPIGRSLHSTVNWTGWTVTIYQLGQIISLPLAGKLSDHFGRKQTYLVAVALFMVFSLCCGLSTDIYMLIASRFVQALAGAALMPCATGILSDHFGHDRDRAIGMFTSVVPLGGVIGPVFGGVIAEDWSWRGIFLINVPIGVVLLALGLRFIPIGVRRGGERVDLSGLSLMVVALLSGMFAITALGNVPGSSPRFYLPLLAGCVVAAAFVRHTRRHADPFIPERLLWGRGGFAAMNVLNVFYGSAAVGLGALVPLYAVNRYHLSIASAGSLLAARGVGMGAVVVLAVAVLRRTGYRLPMIVGFSLIGIGSVMLYVGTPSDVSAYGWLAIWSAITGVGMGIAAPASNNATLQLAPDQIAHIAGLRGMFRSFGSIGSVSIATALLARSSHPGVTQSHLFLVQAASMGIAIALVFGVPEHKGRW